ncbi:putative leader peptide [Actinokineospora cianjurensis]|uniref:putative leader peptide n=1 Tax=Actinokineospora cianjurensis TaxID=585224 RepID=UPI003CCC87D9
MSDILPGPAARPGAGGARPVTCVPASGWWWTTPWTRGTLTPMSATEVFLVARRHVDFQRVSSAMCRQHR